MKRVRINDVEAESWNPAKQATPLSEALGTSELAINYFVLGPGDRFGFDLHRHHDQEEVFYIQEGTVTFETEDGETEISSGEVVRFAPGEFQLGVNKHEAHVVALALGSPRGSREVEYLRECPTCDERTVQTLQTGKEVNEFAVFCNMCGTDTVSHLRE